VPRDITECSGHSDSARCTSAASGVHMGVHCRGLLLYVDYTLTRCEHVHFVTLQDFLTVTSVEHCHTHFPIAHLTTALPGPTPSPFRFDAPRQEPELETKCVEAIMLMLGGWMR
jgi:hypothetical protein